MSKIKRERGKNMVGSSKDHLMHGDIRLWSRSSNKEIGIVDLSDAESHMIWENHTLRNKWGYDDIMLKSESIGNLKDIFADLNRNREDLCEFRVDTCCSTVGHITARIAKNSILIGIKGYHEIFKYFTFDQMKKFHQLLGQLLATDTRERENSERL